MMISRGMMIKMTLNFSLRLLEDHVPFQHIRYISWKSQINHRNWLNRISSFFLVLKSMDCLLSGFRLKCEHFQFNEPDFSSARDIRSRRFKWYFIRVLKWFRFHVGNWDWKWCSCMYIIYTFASLFTACISSRVNKIYMTSYHKKANRRRSMNSARFRWKEFTIFCNIFSFLTFQSSLLRNIYETSSSIGLEIPTRNLTLTKMWQIINSLSYLI